MAPRLQLQLADKFCLIGICVSFALYGCNIYLFVRWIRTRSRRDTTSRAQKSKLWIWAVTCMTFALTSTYLFLEAYEVFTGFTKHRDSPVGFVAMMNKTKLRGIWLVEWASGLGSAWLQQSLMCYQCFLIYSPQGRISWITSFSAVFLLASTGTGLYLLIFSTFLNIRVLSHFPVCIAARISTSSLIIAKLFLRQKGLKANFGDNPELLSPYTFLIRAFIQSYALYSFVSLVFLALFIGHESAWRLLLPCLPQAGLIAHLLIQVRVTQNRNSELSNSEKQSTSVEFAGSFGETSIRDTTNGV